ncbi:MAG TPA: hypothetical protein VH912_11845 [Streptosporangiaceae bacterium]|jgi:hypothetical protein
MTVTQPSGLAVPLRGPHRPRAIRFLGLHETVGWTLKVYGIAAHGERPRQALVEAVRSMSSTVLPSPAVWSGDGDPDRYGVGFVILHDAGDYCFALFDWWAAENEIHQRLYSAPLDRPDAMGPHPTPAIGCVWEMAVHDHERRAWLRHVLARPEGPDLGAYLRDRFEGDI